MAGDGHGGGHTWWGACMAERHVWQAACMAGGVWQEGIHVSRLRAVGCGLVIPVITFMLTSDVHRSVYASGRYGDSVWDGYRILFILGGGHALTSPKGGRPCPLGTLNYEVVGHLAYR